jgi:hypothetical protein
MGDAEETRTRRHRVPALLLLALAAALAAQAPSRPLVFVGGTLVDVSNLGRSTGDVADAVVIVQGGRIAAAGPRTSVRVPAGAQVVDAAGTFIVPGLNDVFATVNNQAQANAFLYMGVTGIVGLDEPGGRRGPLLLGAKPGPRVYPLDDVTGYDASGLPPEKRTVYDLTTLGRKLTDTELRAEIDRLAASGVRVLLLYYTLAPDQVRLAASYARQLGLATIGELGATTYREAIDAGVMAFVHTSRYSLELAPAALRAEVARAPFGPPRRRFYEHLAAVRDDDPTLQRYAKTLAAGRTALIPTLAMNYLELPGHANPWKKPVAVLLDPKDIHLPANRETGEQERAENSVRDAFPPGATARLHGIESAYCRAGATYLAGSGTDAFGTMAGISLHIELEMLVKACLSPRQALAAATANVGTVFGWSRVGQVKPGFDADLLVLEADPTADIGNLERIRQVMRGGELIDRASLLEGAANRP